MRQALTLALQGFDGAMVIVSHDRHLLRNTVDQFWLVSEGRVCEFEGDLEDYERWLADRRREPEAATDGRTGPETAPDSGAGNRESAEDRRARKRREAELRQKLSPFRKRLTALETEMERLQGTLAQLEQALADPGLYEASAKARLKELLAQQAEARGALATAEAEWLELGETVESMERELAR